MQQQQQQQQQLQQQQLHQGQQPPAKRQRNDVNEAMYLPSAADQQLQLLREQQQQFISRNQAQQASNGIVTAQQIALAQAAVGAGGLADRLGFTLPTSNAHTASNGVQAAVQAAASGINLPVGIGLRFGAGGISQQQTLQNFGTNTSVLQAAIGGGPLHVTNVQYGVNPLQQQHVATQNLNPEEATQTERRLRNREHAKRSRVRKKFMLESLQQQVKGLQDENGTLRLLVQKHIPKHALKIIDECCSKSILFRTADGANAGKKGDKDAKETPLLRSDFSLIESLTSGQQNFVLSDPRLPDNPIVFASPGFYELTGYTREQVLGRNCRFLQGNGTDRKAIEVIKTAVANGTDATVCLLNYKADGTPFWNQLFVAALRDSDNCIVNYVSGLRLYGLILRTLSHNSITTAGWSPDNDRAECWCQCA